MNNADNAENRMSDAREELARLAQGEVNCLKEISRHPRGVSGDRLDGFDLATLLLRDLVEPFAKNPYVLTPSARGWRVLWVAS